MFVFNKSLIYFLGVHIFWLWLNIIIIIFKYFQSNPGVRYYSPVPNNLGGGVITWGGG